MICGNNKDVSSRQFCTSSISRIFFSPGLSLLLLGCALIFLSGIMVAVSAILYIKAKKLRKGQKLQSSGNTMSQISKNCKIELKYKKKKNSI